jgi:hypothetical protein
METTALLRALLAIVLLSLGGLATASLVAPGGSLALRAGWAFGVGSGWLTLAAAATAGLGFPSTATFWAPLLPLGVWASRRAWRREAPLETAEVPRHLADWALPTLLVAVLAPAVALVVTTTEPGWDGVTIWHFKGRMLYVDGGISLAALADPVRGYSHPEYPLHLPLLLAGLARAMGRWEDAVLLAVAPLAYGSLLLLLYGTARLVARRWVALAVVAGVAPLPGLVGHFVIGFADLPLAMYSAGTLAGLVRWLTRGDRGALLLAGLVAGLGAWTKQEGWLLLGANCLAAWLFAPRCGRERAALAAPLAVALTVAAPWQIIRLVAGIDTDPYALRGWESLRRLPTILGAVAGELARFGRWGALWLAAIGSSLPWGRMSARSRLAAFPATLLWTTIAAYVVVYATTPHDLVWHLATSVPRLLLHVLPAAACLVAVRLETLAESGGRPAAETS